MPLSRWLHALAIPDVGETIAFDLGRTHRDIRDVADSEMLKGISELDDLCRNALKTSTKTNENKHLPPEEKARLEPINKQYVAKADALASELIAKGLLNKPVGKLKPRTATGLFGPNVARSVLSYFNSTAGQKTLSRLAELGIDPQGDSAGPLAHPLSGKTFVLTGTLKTLARSEAKERLRVIGANVGSAVSKQTDYLVVGDDPGSKVDQAAKLGITQLTEEEFIALIARTTPEAAAPASEDNKTQLDLL
jgi:DNA ligase (NAD+)